MELKKVSSRDYGLEDPTQMEKKSEQSTSPQINISSKSPLTSPDTESVVISIVTTSEEQKSIDDLSTRRLFLTNLISYVRELSEQIEVHGIRYLFEEGRSTFERLLWLMIIIISLIICIILIYIVHNIFLITPVIVSFSTRGTPTFDVPFPAVTVCSQVKSKSSEYNFLKIQKKIVKTEEFSADEENFFYQYVYLVCDYSVHKENFSSISKVVNISDDEFFETMSKVSPSVDDIMHHCTYLHIIVNCSVWFKPVYTNVGPCFTFNMVRWSKIFRETAKIQSGFFESPFFHSDLTINNFYKSQNIATFPIRGFLNGAANSLQVFLKQKKNQVDPVCTHGISGFKVTIHNPLDVPNLKNYFVQVPLNKSVMMAVEPQLFKLSDFVKALPVKTRKCYLPNEKLLKFFQRYTHTNCLTECLTNFTLEACGCVAFHMPREKLTPICTTVNLACLQHVENQFNINSLVNNLKNKRRHFQVFNFCDCKPFCTELLYRVEVSNSDWFNWSKSRKNSSDNSLKDYDLSHFSVFFKEEYFRSLEKVEFFGVADLMANVGGLLNFFIGSSILTGIEIFYSFTLKILCNKFIYGPWAGPAAVEYNYVLE